MLKETVRSLDEEVSRLQEELESRPSVETVEQLHRDLRKEKDRVKRMWKTNCEQDTTMRN